MDGVEIHAAHPHLLGIWLSPGRNHRRDGYGGSLANRARLVLEILGAVRRACPPPFAVGVRINAAWIAPAGQTLDEGVELARASSTRPATPTSSTSAGGPASARSAPRSAS